MNSDYCQNCGSPILFSSKPCPKCKYTMNSISQPHDSDYCLICKNPILYVNEPCPNCMAQELADSAQSNNVNEKHILKKPIVLTILVLLILVSINTTLTMITKHKIPAIGEWLGGYLVVTFYNQKFKEPIPKITKRKISIYYGTIVGLICFPIMLIAKPNIPFALSVAIFVGILEFCLFYFVMSITQKRLSARTKTAKRKL